MIKRFEEVILNPESVSVSLQAYNLENKRGKVWIRGNISGHYISLGEKKERSLEGYKEINEREKKQEILWDQNCGPFHFIKGGERKVSLLL